MTDKHYSVNPKNKEKLDVASKLFSKGFSMREVANEIFGDKSKVSTIHSWKVKGLLKMNENSIDLSEFYNLIKKDKTIKPVQQSISDVVNGIRKHRLMANEEFDSDIESDGVSDLIDILNNPNRTLDEALNMALDDFN